MDRLTRKDLKTDKFALEVEHTVEYVAEHRKAVIRYTAIGLAVVVIVAGIFFFRKQQRAARQEALGKAMQVMEAPVGPAPEGAQSFPTQAAKNAALQKALASVAAEYSGSDEGTIARYYMGVNFADQGNMAEAEKALKEVVDNGDDKYASLAKLSLVDIYRSQGKTADAEKLLRSLIDKPTVFVSKDSATLMLGRLLAENRPAEARKLLEPLAAGRGPASRQALSAIGDLQNK